MLLGFPPDAKVPVPYWGFDVSLLTPEESPCYLLRSTRFLTAEEKPPNNPRRESKVFGTQRTRTGFSGVWEPEKPKSINNWLLPGLCFWEGRLTAFPLRTEGSRCGCCCQLTGHRAQNPKRNRSSSGIREKAHSYLLKPTAHLQTKSVAGVIP